MANKIFILISEGGKDMTFKQLCKIFSLIVVGAGIFTTMILCTILYINNIFLNVILVLGYIFLLMWTLLCTKLGDKLWEWFER